MMNEIPFTRNELRRGLSGAVAKLDIELSPPPFWKANHRYCSDPSLQLADLWLYYNRAGMRNLLTVVKDAFAYIDFRPATTNARAQEARVHLMSAYVGDELGIQTFLHAAPPYLDNIIQALCSEQEPCLTPELLHDAMQALLCLNSLLSTQPVPASFIRA